MSMNSVPERLAALRAAMKANGVDVYLIPVGDPHASEYLPEHYTSLTYFSGFHGENSNFVVTMTESAVWADGRYFVQAEKEIAGTEIQLQKMGEPGVPTVEEYCAKVLPEGGKLGLCGLTASCGLVRGLEKALEAKHGRIKTLNLEDELWTEGRPALPATPAWILPKEYAGFSPAEKLGQLRAKLQELGCTAQLVGKLDNLAWLLNLRAMDIQCTPYAMAYCYVTENRAVLFLNTARLKPEAAAELKENGVTIAEYDDVLRFLAAETEPQTVLADPASVNFAVYETLKENKALTVKDEADPLLPMKGIKNEVELAHTKEAHIRDAVAMVRFQKELEERLAAGEELTELTVDEILHKYRSAQDKFLGTSLLEFRLVADEAIFLLFLSGFGLSYGTHGEWVLAVAIQGFGVGESQGVAILPFLGVIHFYVGDGSSVVVVDDDFLLLPVAFTRSEDDGSCILEHGDEIGHHDGLRKEVFVGAEQVGALPFPSALRIPISSVRSPQ